MKSIAVLSALLFAASLAACTDPQADAARTEDDGSQALLGTYFEGAAEEFDVPAEILLAVAWVETQWQMIEGIESNEPGARPAAYGIMALRKDTIETGAELSWSTPDDVRFDAADNIRAAAALLDRHARALDVDRGDLGDWAEAVAEFSGIGDEEGTGQYVADVYEALRTGRVLRDERGDVVLELSPSDATPNFAAPAVHAVRSTTDYPSAIWRASPNYNSRPTGTAGTITTVILHTCEGGYSGCWSWLKDPAAGVSAHYVVKEDGGEVSQLVRETGKAWHIGATYDCTLNSNHDCSRNGSGCNNFTVGIELAGYASGTRSTGQIDTLAKLVCDITRDRTIPRDRLHIIGHAQLQPYNKKDPGASFPWTTFINKTKEYCGDTVTSTEIIVDSNNANNDSSKAKFVASSSWKSSSSVSGYYGSGYYYGAATAIADAAQFQFYLATAQSRTVDAWWTSASDRTTAAPYVVVNASGVELGRTNQNQQTNGGKWVTLGTYSFSAGWNSILLSRWTSGSVVIADAIRVR